MKIDVIGKVELSGKAKEITAWATADVTSYPSTDKHDEFRLSVYHAKDTDEVMELVDNEINLIKKRYERFNEKRKEMI